MMKPLFVKFKVVLVFIAFNLSQVHAQHIDINLLDKLNNLNRYIAPAPTPSRLNISFFVSNGYLVFTPDISYETGYPGRSAEEYINSGVNALKKNSWVDGSK